ncbi:hypothetical protein TSAR_012875 [Trichomalopsis sarcophagae]|uniref:Uncharacterized protein n=1 Tax=Trichomalopsis sarcophagae TaxID=543379 RepID=A0A232EPQ4_9HYME|nr:hypothetical protein TSAR_012875 [Trichomalopsis sarcophagae]
MPDFCKTYPRQFFLHGEQQTTSATSQDQFTPDYSDDIYSQLSFTHERTVHAKTYKQARINQPPINGKEGTTQTSSTNLAIRKKPKCDTQIHYDFQDVVIDYLMYLADSVDEIHAQQKNNIDEIASIKTLLLKQSINANKIMLLSGLNSNLVISKCMVNILKMVLSREVAMQYTALKEAKDKNVMMNTNFYSCISEIIKERRMASYLSVTDKDFKTGLSNVLTNASDDEDDASYDDLSADESASQEENVLNSSNLNAIDLDPRN